jgi:predicted NBD/HSP70 family sugar kinase
VTIMNIDACPVAELGRLMDAQFDAIAAAERAGNEDARKAADAWATALRAAQTTVQATSVRGVALQSIELDIAAHGIFGEPAIEGAIAGASLEVRDEVEKVMRLIRLMRKACDALALETAGLGPGDAFNPRTGMPLDTVDSHSDPAEAMRAA